MPAAPSTSARPWPCVSGIAGDSSLEDRHLHHLPRGAGKSELALMLYMVRDPAPQAGDRACHESGGHPLRRDP